MSEDISKLLGNFDSNKSAYEKEQQQLAEEEKIKDAEEFEKAVFMGAGGHGGGNDYSDDARRRLTEGDAYIKHLKQMSESSQQSSGHLDVFHRAWDLTESEHERNQDHPVIELLSDKRNAINQLRSDIDAKIKQLRIQYEIAKKNSNVSISFEQFLSGNLEVDAAKNTLRELEDQLQSDMIKYSKESFMTERMVDELIDGTDQGPNTYADRDKSLRLDIMIKLHEMAGAVDKDITDMEEILRADPGTDRNIIEGSYSEIIDKILSYNKEIDGLLERINDSKMKRVIAEQTQHIINDRIQKANKITGNQTGIINKEQFIDTDRETRHEVISKLDESIAQFKIEFQKVENIFQEQEINGDDARGMVDLLSNMLNSVKKDATTLANNMTDVDNRTFMHDYIENVVTACREEIKQLVDIYNEKVKEVETEKDADMELEQVVNNPNISNVQKQNALRNWFNKHPRLKKTLAWVVIGIVSMNMFGSVQSDNNSYSQDAYAATSAHDYNYDKDGSVEKNGGGDIEQNKDEDMEKENDVFAYEKHKYGDSIVFNKDIYERLQEERSGPNSKYAFGPSLFDKLREMGLEYNEQNVLKSLLENAYYNPKVIIGYFMKHEVEVDGEVIKVTNENSDELFARMKNDPKFYGHMYDVMMSVLTQEGNIFEFGYAKDNESSIYAFKDANGRTIFGTSTMGNGDSSTLIVKDKKGNIIAEFRINCGGQKVGVYSNIQIPPKPDPDPDPETNPITDPIDPPQPNPGKDNPVRPIIPPTTDTIEGNPSLQEKDPTVDINVNKNLNEQFGMGEQRVGSGGYRAPENYTEEYFNSEVDLEKSIKDAQSVINEDIEKMAEQYKQELSEQEINTLQENQTGQGESQKSHSEIVKETEAVNNQVEDVENNEMVSPI